MADRIVCITGAAGFIGSHLVREFLERGFQVRGTVRDRQNKVKNAHLLALPGADERLQLFSADLQKPGSFTEPVKGAEWLVHAAAAVKLASRKPQEEIVNPTVEGTANLLGAVRISDSVKRIGLVSSVAAIFSTARREGHRYTEDDWCDDATLQTNPYGLAKTQSERMMHDFCEQAGAPFLTVINPAVVTGPVMSRLHTNSSVSIVRDIYVNAFRGCPRLGFGIVDVRDVARAMHDALERMVSGRTILCAGSLWLEDVAAVIQENFPDARVSTRRLPNFAMYLAALFDRRLSFSFLRRNLGYMPELSNDRLVQDLGISVRAPSDSIVDTCRSLIEKRALGRRG